MPEFLKVLIADDDFDDHVFFKEALKDLDLQDIEIIEAFDGVQALDILLKCGKYKDSNESLPDLIVLDLNMPLLDGYSVLKKLRTIQQFETIPIYILTTSRDLQQQEMCHKAGCSGFFTKPPNLKEFSEAIHKMVDDARFRIMR